MAVFTNSSLLLVKSLPTTKTLPKLRSNFLINSIKWDGARIRKSHPNRATTVNMWSPEILKNISEFVKGSKGFNDSLYSFVKLYKAFDLVKSFFDWIIKTVKGRGDGGEIGGKRGADGHETGDKEGTDGNAAGSGVDSNDAAAKGGAARGRSEAGGGREQAADGGGLRVEFVFVFSLSVLIIFLRL